MSIQFDELRSERPAGGPASRRRWIAIIGAVMLVAAAAGAGYGIGRNVDGDAATSAVDDEGRDETVAPTTAPTASTGAPAAAPDTASTAPERLIESSDGVGRSASGGAGWTMFGFEQMELLVDRLTDTGQILRVHLGPVWDQDVMVPEGEWQPAPWCYESGQMRVALAGNGVIDVGSVPWYREPFRGRAVSWVTLGHADGQPTTVLVVQVPGDTENVVVTLDSGETDAMVPQNGVAVLAVPGSAPTEVLDGPGSYWIDEPPVFRIELQGGSSAGVVDNGSVGTWDDPEFRESCTPPPPALPPAGEQPADPAAADAEIRAAMAALYGVVGSDELGSDLIDDPTGVGEARRQVQEGVFAEDAADASAEVEELVFTAPDEAWFRYSIDTPGNDFDDRYGIAVFVDGRWKITRSTVCQDLALAGGDCGGDWMSIFPPGAFPDDGFVPTPTILED